MSYDRVDVGWQPLFGYVDPPSPPEGYRIEVKRDYFLGFVIAYRFVKET